MFSAAMIGAVALRVLRRRRILCRSSSSGAAERTDPPTTLSARLAFVFDQLDALDSERAAKDQAIQRIRSWHQIHRPPDPSPSPPPPRPPGEQPEAKEESMRDVFKREVELSHPWPEWIEFMERLAGQKYFEFERRTDEETIARNASIDLSGIAVDTGFDFSRDWTTVRNASMNFGRDRFDILRALAKKDIQVLVGQGCPSLDSKVVFSAKLLRKYAHLDEGDVCSACSLRNTCSRGYILTNKEDEARTLDVVRILQTYGFDHVNDTVENKQLMKKKTIRTVVRKLLHEIVKLSAVPIDPNLPPPVIKKAPPKVKQPPPQPKKRVGRDDVEMKKGDWLCPKCDFMNFAKNVICLQCDAKCPKRQLLPGEWECPKCNFLNYRRNMSCFQCEHTRPEDEYTDNQMREREPSPRIRKHSPARISDVSDAWNFNFDDNESDGADVAAFEFADSSRSPKDPSLVGTPDIGLRRESDDYTDSWKEQSSNSRAGFLSESEGRKDGLHSRTGFDDFDDEGDHIDNYELDMSNGNSAGDTVPRRNFSDVDKASDDSEDIDDIDLHPKTKQSSRNHLSGQKEYYSESEDGLRDHPHWKSSHVADPRRSAGSGGRDRRRGGLSYGSDEDDLGSDFDEDMEHGFQSSKRKTFRRGTERRRNGHGRLSDSDEDLLGSESDDGDRIAKMMERRGGAAERSAFCRGRGGFRSNDDRRNSFRSRNNERPLRGSSRSSRHARGDENGGWRDCNELRSGNRQPNGRGGFGRRRQGGSDGYSDRSNDVGDDRPRRRRIIER